MDPVVTFVVPCYNLAHLLPECVQSILAQSFGDLEILVMDDCSPDNTGEVVRSFNDPRVIHVRNNPNLGHLRNYNKGIDLARGKYVWLISADDRLRSPEVLRVYVEVMEKNPRVGFAFCPAIGMRNAREEKVLAWTASCGDSSRVFPGRELLAKMVYGNCVAAASGLVRKECYDKLGAFPLDLPYAGDWYMWCIFALFYDAAYFAEPMVNYRLHEQSMTNLLAQQQRMADIIAVPWRIRHAALDAGIPDIAEHCLQSLASHYGFCAAAEHFGSSDYALSLAGCEESMRTHARGPEELRRTHAAFCARFADHCYLHGDRARSLELYRRALREQAWAPLVLVKYALLHMGRIGHVLRCKISGTQPTLPMSSEA